MERTAPSWLNHRYGHVLPLIDLNFGVDLRRDLHQPYAKFHVEIRMNVENRADDPNPNPNPNPKKTLTLTLTTTFVQMT